MNFLSHFYLTEEREDTAFNVGLTLPDIIQYHASGSRVNRKFLLGTVQSTAATAVQRSCSQGMLIHLEVDKWFHKLPEFNESMKLVQDDYALHSKGAEELPWMYSHILVEILIDRYLMTIDPGLDYRFYSNFRSFDHSVLVPWLEPLKKFDARRFLAFTSYLGKSSFIHDYNESHSILDILQRVAARKQLADPSQLDEERFAYFVQVTYNALEDTIRCLVESARDLWHDRRDTIAMILDKYV
jgi:acyl carrier protein phosphodiesterase